MEGDILLDSVTKKFIKKRKGGKMVRASQVELAPKDNEEEREEVEDENEEEEVEERSEAEQINELLDKGYDARQIVKEFGFNRETVRKQVKKRVLPEEESKGEEERLPAVLRRAEVITPEAIMQEYLLEDGDEGRGMIKGMMLLRAAQRMVMDDVEIMKGMAESDARKLAPILKLMAETRKEQDAAAERAKASNEAIAIRAAEDALAGVIQYLSEQKPEKVDIAMAPNPMMGVMARAMEPALTQALGKMFGMFGGKSGQQRQQPQIDSLPPGWSEKKDEKESSKE